MTDETIIAVIGVVVSIFTFVLGNDASKKTRNIIGTVFLLLTVAFISVSYFTNRSNLQTPGIDSEVVTPSTPQGNLASCPRPISDLNQIKSETIGDKSMDELTEDDVKAFKNKLDVYFEVALGKNDVDSISCLGAWSAEEAIGFTIPAGAYFWTNLYEDRYITPTPEPIGANGGWGLFVSEVDFTIESSLNDGGRYIIFSDR